MAAPVAGKYGGLLRALSPASKEIVRAAVPSAIATTGFNLLGGTGLGPSLLSGLVDLGFSAGGMKLVGKIAPGTKGKISYMDPGTKKMVTEEHFIPSMPQNLIQGLSPVVSSMAIMPLIQNQQIQQATAEPLAMDQTATAEQQLMQRDYINQLQQEALSPGTMFQLQGIESTLNRTPDISDYLSPSARLLMQGG